MYYCGNCGGSVSGLGICPHCGALLQRTAEGSPGGQNVTKENHQRYEEQRKRREKESRRKAAQIKKYGYEPAIGIAPTLVMEGVSVIGLVLSCIFSPLFLIMFGVGLFLAFLLFLSHIAGCSSSSKRTHVAEASWLIYYAVVLMFGGLLVVINNISQGADLTAAMMVFIIGVLLSVAMGILNKKVFK